LIGGHPLGQDSVKIKRSADRLGGIRSIASDHDDA